MALKVDPESILLDRKLQKQSESLKNELGKLSKWQLSRQQKKILKTMKDKHRSKN